MSSFDIVRAWKDPEYRLDLNPEEQALLPEHPAGSIELMDEQLHSVAGGSGTGLNGCGADSFLSACYVCPDTLEIG